MYWKEIPVQVQTEEGSETVSVPLDSRFQQAVDSISMMEESFGTDDYLDGWQWGQYHNIEIAAAELSSLVTDLYNKCMPEDFVKRIRDAHNNNSRNPSPEAIDIWLSESKQYSCFSNVLGKLWT